MPRDYGSHKKMREHILAQMPRELKTYSSHEGIHDIALFRKNDGEEIYLAEPDIVTFKGRRILIIEIELSDQPKKLFGDACSSFLSTNGRHGAVEFDLDRRSLLVVLGHSDAVKKKQGKRKNSQLDEVTSLVKSLLAFESFEIVSEADAIPAVVRWAKSD
jgi:hypothetical protein